MNSYGYDTRSTSRKTHELVFTCKDFLPVLCEGASTGYRMCVPRLRPGVRALGWMYSLERICGRLY